MNDGVTKLDKRWLASNSAECALLVVAAGFEARATRSLELLGGSIPQNVVVLEYPPSIEGNDRTRDQILDLLRRSGTRTVHEFPINLLRPDELIALMKGLGAELLRDVSGEVWVDVSALPMQSICACLCGLREALPSTTIRVLYTEARHYFPTKSEASNSDEPLAALSQEMSRNLVPKEFSGTSNETSSCLLLFAGYEKHRSLGVVDELNPSKLVLLYGRPANDDLSWRLKYSKRLHDPLGKMRPTATETVSTLDPMDSLRRLNLYYGFLFADHNFSIAPVCSKMQCVAAFLFWERYRDVQLVFPVPVTYLPHRFSEGFGATYSFTLPQRAKLAGILPTIL